MVLMIKDHDWYQDPDPELVVLGAGTINSAGQAVTAGQRPLLEAIGHNGCEGRRLRPAGQHVLETATWSAAAESDRALTAVRARITIAIASDILSSIRRASRGGCKKTD